MKASEWVELPAVKADLQAAVLAAEFMAIEWYTLTATSKSGTVVRLEVSAEPLRIGELGDYLYAPVSADTAQALSEKLGVLQPTAKILNLLWAAVANGYRIAPPIQPPDKATRIEKGFSPSMSDAQASLRFARDCIAQLETIPPHLPLAVPFKVWLISNQLLKIDSGLAINYGMFSNGALYRATSGQAKVWQPLASKHNRKHFDYSQVFFAVRESCTVDGVPTSTRQMLADPELCELFSDEGPLLTFRQNSAPVVTPVLPPAVVATPRTLRRGMSGSDVAALQTSLKLRADGQFGQLTEAAVKDFQRTRGLTADGIVGPATRQAIANGEAVRKTATVELLGSFNFSADGLFEIDSFLQARCYRKGRSAAIQDIVIHSADIVEMPTSAEALARYAANMPTDRIASWHAALDANSIAQSVKWEDTAFHAPGLNESSIGLEFSGYARQTREEWSDDFSAAMLERGAKLCAALCLKFNINPTFRNAADLKSGLHGITTHREVTYAFRRSTHTDPGLGFPMAEFINRIRAIIGDVRQ